MNARLPWNRPTLTDRDRAVLDAVEDALSGRATPESETGALGLFAARMAAAAPQPNAAFGDQLLPLTGRLPDDGKRPRPPVLAVRGMPLLAAALALAFAMGTALPVVGDGAFKRIRLRESTEPPPFLGAPSDFPKPPELTWTDPAQLAKRIGITVFLPDYLPDECEKWGSWGYNREGVPPSVYLQYSCVVIGTMSGGGIGRKVPAGSLAEITVSGHPALYQRGTWVLDPQTGAHKWSDSQTIYLEREGSVITLTSVRTVSREDMIRIAESLRPVSPLP